MSQLPCVLAMMLTLGIAAPEIGRAKKPHSVAEAPAPHRAPGPPTACIGHWLEVRYRPFGYDHIVHIRNKCTKAAACTVTTDVNPQPTQVSVAANTEVEAVTWVGSPAQTFTANVSCKLID
jgi:hypothetical protein